MWRLKRDKPHNVQQKIVSTILKVKKVNNMYAEFKVLILVAALPLMTVWKFDLFYSLNVDL